MLFTRITYRIISSKQKYIYIFFSTSTLVPKGETTVRSGHRDYCRKWTYSCCINHCELDYLFDGVCIISI